MVKGVLVDQVAEYLTMVYFQVLVKVGLVEMDLHIQVQVFKEHNQMIQAHTDLVILEV